MADWRPPKNPIMAAISSRLCRSLAREIEIKLETRARGTLSRKKQSDFWLIRCDVACARDLAVHADISVAVAPDWMLRVPQVQALAPFMKYNAEWHADKNAICYVNPVEWYEEHLKRVKYFLARDPEDAI